MFLYVAPVTCVHLCMFALCQTSTFVCSELFKSASDDADALSSRYSVSDRFSHQGTVRRDSSATREPQLLGPPDALGDVASQAHGSAGTIVGDGNTVMREDAGPGAGRMSSKKRAASFMNSTSGEMGENGEATAVAAGGLTSRHRFYVDEVRNGRNAYYACIDTDRGYEFMYDYYFSLYPCS